MKLSTKNIDKLTRTIERQQMGLRTDTSLRCFSCEKRIKKNKFLATINGFGFLNYYHPNCLLTKC